MSLASFDRTQRYVLCFIASALCCASTVTADPLLSPFDSYPMESAIGESAIGRLVAEDKRATESSTTFAEPELGKALPEITDPVQRIMHSVVVVEAKARDGARTMSTFGADRKGTGVVIDSNGLIATAGYIVAEAETVKVTFANGITDEAEIVAYDDSLGVGLLRTKNFRSTLALELGDSSEIEDQQKALILPGSGEKGALSVTIGKVKAFTGGWEYMLDDAIHTYPPSTDFSGAALLSENAKLLGIGALVSIDIDIDPKVRVPGNIFIPIDALKVVMGELLSQGRSQSSVKPWLGFETKDTKAGVKVGAVYEDAPAANSGIKAGDKIIAVDQMQVTSLKDMYAKIWTEHKPGDKVHLLILRDNQYANVPVDTVDRYEWLKLQDSAQSETKITELVE